MDKEKNNILILTLGTGQVTKKEFTFDKNRPSRASVGTNVGFSSLAFSE